ncbi:MAG: TM1812 family CRISPR-associated protein [Geminicoccaceae bacterium]
MTTRPTRLVSFIGTSKYDPVTYELDGRRAGTTPYVARALAELLEPAEVVVLATAEAEGKHRAALEQAFAEAGIAAPRFVKVPAGGHRAELFELFRILREQLRMGDGSIVLDITHGFRAQPFFAASVVAFARAVDEKPAPLRVVYGAFEPGRNHAPVWDLSYLTDVLDWALALRLFLRTGRAGGAAEETRRLGHELRKIWNEGGRQGEPPRLKELGEALERFGDDLETLRTGDLLLGRRGKESSARELAEKLAAAEDEVVRHLPPLAEVLDSVRGMVTPLTGAFTNLKEPMGRKAVAALAELYLKLGRYLEAIATVREGLVNDSASESAAKPGARDFAQNARDEAERQLGASNQFRAVADLRNDLLHAQYRPEGGARQANQIVDQVRDAVEAFGRQTGAGDVGS